MNGRYLNDALYGHNIYISRNIEPLFYTELASRARDITMGTVPNYFRVNGHLQSRFNHGVGVMHLAKQVIEANKSLDDHSKNLIMVSGLMHDWGNSALAHLIERLMKVVISEDGESYLRVLLDSQIGKSTKEILRNNLGLSCDDVVDMVTGNKKPFSNIVHGDMDVDNLDNILRHLSSTGRLKSEDKNVGLGIAPCFYWDDSRWCLKDYDIGSEKKLPQLILSWKRLRREVYEDISSAPHLVVATMLFSAAWQAHEKGLFKPEHFLYSDSQMLRLLDKFSPVIMEKIWKWQWFDQKVNHKTTTPSPRLKAFADNFESRMNLAYRLATKLKIDINELTVFVGNDRMERVINLPVWNEGVTVEDWLVNYSGDTIITNPVTYRVQVNIDPAVDLPNKYLINEFVEQEIL